jgi:sugar lactone lactonase YvrE
MSSNTICKQDGITVAGGNGQGNQLNQLNYPWGVYVDDNDQRIYIAEWANHRIVEWKYGAKNDQVVAGENGGGTRMNQLYRPADVIVDQRNDCLIISDYGNRRVVRWSRQNGTNRETIISDIDCFGLTLNNNGDIYVCDSKKHEVRQWKARDEKGTIGAGGNEKGNQLNGPSYIFVDEDHSVYVSDSNNHRVIKWMKGVKEGIVVAGGQGKGNSLRQLCAPRGMLVDQ